MPVRGTNVHTEANKEVGMQEEKDDDQLSDDQLEEASGGTGEDMPQDTGGMDKGKGGSEIEDPPGGN